MCRCRAARPRTRRAPRGSCPWRLSSANSVQRCARSIVGRVAVAVQPGPERRLRIAADGAGHEHAIAPHDRARVREARDRRAPAARVRRLRVPGVGQLLAVRDTRRLRAAERRPAAGRGRERLRRRAGQRRDHDLPPRHHHRFGRQAPRAAVQDHAPRLAGIRDQRERRVPVHRVDAVARRLARTPSAPTASAARAPRPAWSTCLRASAIPGLRR